MGLFDKRKKGADDFDSPVEKIDLSAPAADPIPEPRTAHTEAPDDDDHYAAVARAPEPEPEAEPPPYGINDAIQLMRALPQDNVELVVQVVKRTLESTKVQVTAIIDDASRKQETIENRIGVLKREIADFEEEISTRRGEIDRLEADHAETTTVKERLQLAEKLGKGASPPPNATPPAASSSAPSAPIPRPRTPTGPMPTASTPPGPSSTPKTSGGAAQAASKGTITVKK